MQTDFNYHHFMKKPLTDKNFWSGHLMEEVDEHVRKIYPEIPNSGYVAQSVNNFPCPCEKEMESAENSITLDKMRASQKKILAS